MTGDANSETMHSRRRVLSIVGATGAVAIAGCSGGNDAGGDAGGTGGTPGDEDESASESASSAGKSLDCGQFSGTLTAFSPGDLGLAFTFDFPNDWERYNEASANNEKIIGLYLGHSATATTASYPVNVYFGQPTKSVDEEAATRWLTMPPFESAGTLDYDGTEVDVSTYATDGGTQWQFALPYETDGETSYYPITYQVSYESEYAGCKSEILTTAQTIMHSVRPNPSFSP